MHYYTLETSLRLCTRYFRNKQCSGKNFVHSVDTIYDSVLLFVCLEEFWHDGQPGIQPFVSNILS